MSVKIYSLGAAVQDVFLSGEVLKAQKEDGEWVEEFKLGEKYDLDDITFSTGGGATNGAVTFARQGLKSFFIGKIGDDPAGKAVLADLEKDNVNSDNVAYSKKYATGYSVLLVAPRGERVVLTYRGASSNYRPENFDFAHISGDWFFITSLAGNTQVIEAALKCAEQKNMKVAFIPGKGELKKNDWVKSHAKNFAIFSANKEETQGIVSGETTEELALNMHKLTGGIAVVTDGPNGVSVCDGNKVCSAGMYEDVPVLDRTGAGDAFASGFTAMIALGRSIEEAITFASANSTSVVGQVGAKAGILQANTQLHDMEISCKSIEELNV